MYYRHLKRVPLFFVALIFFHEAKMHGLRRFFVWSIRGVLFVLLFGLALKNQEIVDLHFFFGQQWCWALPLRSRAELHAELKSDVTNGIRLLVGISCVTDFLRRWLGGGTH